VGLSLGRRVDPRDSKISIVPYVQADRVLVCRKWNVGLSLFRSGWADFRLTPRFDAR